MRMDKRPPPTSAAGAGESYSAPLGALEGGDELMSVRKLLLDSVVVHQARRITELERKLDRKRQTIDRLTKLQSLVPPQGLGGGGGGRGLAKDLGWAAVAPGSQQIYVGPGPQPGPAAAADLGRTDGMGLLASEAAHKCLAMPFARGGLGVGPMGMVPAMMPGMVPGMAAEKALMGRFGIDKQEKKQSRYWAPDEHQRFLAAVKTCGPKNYVQIAKLVGTRNAKQVRTHAQKYQKKLEREEAKRRAAQLAGLSTSSDKPPMVDDSTKQSNTFSTDASDSASNIGPTNLPIVHSATLAPGTEAGAEAEAETVTEAVAEAVKVKVEARTIQAPAKERSTRKHGRDHQGPSESTSPVRQSKRLKLKSPKMEPRLPSSDSSYSNPVAQKTGQQAGHWKTEPELLGSNSKHDSKGRPSRKDRRQTSASDNAQTKAKVKLEDKRITDTKSEDRTVSGHSRCKR